MLKCASLFTDAAAFQTDTTQTVKRTSSRKASLATSSSFAWGLRFSPLARLGTDTTRHNPPPIDGLEDDEQGESFPFEEKVQVVGELIFFHHPIKLWWFLIGSTKDPMAWAEERTDEGEEPANTESRQLGGF
ncbi:MAG: hypothetical protein M1816_000311 [Peltula sp. TS41687]|nr:MAG: hypothetical protein M1816_000311 [Peltula sp. TS41687]